MTLTPQLSPKPIATMSRVFQVIALTILLRAGIIGLHQLQQIDYRQYGNLNFFTLPVLEVIVLLLAVTPAVVMLKMKTRFTTVAMTILMAVVINAVLQIYDMIRTLQICDSDAFYEFEVFCEGIFMQSFCNIPFVAFGSIVLLIYWLNQH